MIRVIPMIVSVENAKSEIKMPPDVFRRDSMSFNDATKLSQKITLQKRLRSLNKRSQSFSFQKKNVFDFPEVGPKHLFFGWVFTWKSTPQVYL